MKPNSTEDILFVLSGSRNYVYRILFFITIILLLLPITYVSTTSYQGSNLVEIRCIIHSAEEFPNTRTQIFTLDFSVLSQVDARFAVPLFNTILMAIYSNPLQNISITYDFSQISPNAKKTDLFSLDQKGPVLMYSIHPIGFEELYLFSLTVTIQFLDNYFFQGYESYRFAADNFLMVPRVSTLFSREIGIKYTEIVYSGPNWGGNPSVPLISLDDNMTDYIRYSMLVGSLLLLYIIILIYRTYKLYQTRKFQQSSGSLYPQKS